MPTLEASDVRQELSNTLNRVAFAGERVVINRHGKQVAALVSVEDLEFLLAAEQQIDLAAAKKALKEKGSIPWAELKRKLGLAGKKKRG